MPNPTRTTVIMSPPDFFAIEYSINPWMNLTNKVDQKNARFQWQTLHDLYKNLGLAVKLIPPVKGLPDLVFTTDHGVWIHDTFYLSNFRFLERQKEQGVASTWYAKQGIKVQNLPSVCYLEGGDVLVHENQIFLGYGFRTSSESAQYLHNTTRLPVVPLELVDESFYHLDTCFLPISADLAFYYPPAFSAGSIHQLKAHFDILLPLTSHEAEGFACNSVKIDNKVICQPNPTFEQKLIELDLVPISLEMSEFNKSGGGIHCLTQIIKV
ncbi:MAG: arginine deiminase family protein [Microgenomates group bacterium]